MKTHGQNKRFDCAVALFVLLVAGVTVFFILPLVAFLLWMFINCFASDMWNLFFSILLLFTISTSVCEAEENRSGYYYHKYYTDQLSHQKLNPYTGKYETIRKDSELTYNPITKKRSFKPEGSILRRNLIQEKWEMAPPKYKERFNKLGKRWETADPKAELKRDKWGKKPDWQYRLPEDKERYNILEGKYEWPR